MNIKTIFKFLLILIILVFVGIVIEYIKDQAEQTNEQDKYQSIGTKILPGKNLDEVYDKFGEPVNQSESNQYSILEYYSSSQAQNHKFYVQDQEVKFMKEIITLDDNIRSSDIFDIHGEPEYILPESNQNTGFNFYVYPDRGLAFRGHEDGIILEIWYFEPMDIETFRHNWAPNLKLSPDEFEGHY